MLARRAAAELGRGIPWLGLPQPLRSSGAAVPASHSPAGHERDSAGLPCLWLGLGSALVSPPLFVFLDSS